MNTIYRTEDTELEGNTTAQTTNFPYAKSHPKLSEKKTFLHPISRRLTLKQEE